MKPKVKICGITNIEDALDAVWCGADILGFVFFKQSKRYIKPKKAKEIIDILPPFVFTVGLFVNENINKVKKIAKYCKFNFLQLHGDENTGYLNKLKDFRLIKAIRVKDKKSLEGLDNLPCDLILFDNYSDSLFGGTGRQFDWNLAKEIKKLKKPYIISGGLTPYNVKKAINLFLPYAVDVSSGVEKSPGKKDKTLIKEFIKNAKTK
ncbi:MAG: phosphoribosylanthranilate isomerase [Candidatus Omnitrophica bacterium]|nr:phosphoribosylanthranilate isomerase [Candidatus Omnitrophota bacterium]MDD5351903.1 phosphoribosylanthranilate isomerase [Candidatus Omnitrophota bacterium]MDD5550729.1 phosphoribosylanthranilate isomerase [Candidatus Omnitrophota bacterium]